MPNWPWDGLQPAIRDEVELDHLTGAPLGLIGETMQPERLFLWMRIKPRKPNQGRG